MKEIDDIDNHLEREKNRNTGKSESERQTSGKREIKEADRNTERFVVLVKDTKWKRDMKIEEPKIDKMQKQSERVRRLAKRKIER